MNLRPGLSTPGTRFCGNCGRPLDAEDVSDVEVIGFSLGGLQDAFCLKRARKSMALTSDMKTSMW